MTNYDHLLKLPPRAVAETIISVMENCCLCCPRERERRCNEDCVSGLTEWMMAQYIQDSVVWKKRRKKT